MNDDTTKLVWSNGRIGTECSDEKASGLKVESTKQPIIKSVKRFGQCGMEMGLFVVLVITLDFTISHMIVGSMGFSDKVKDSASLGTDDRQIWSPIRPWLQ